MAVKSWKKVGDSYYFFLAHKLIGSLQVATNLSTHLCMVKINEADYIFSKTGFWLDGILITDINGNEIGKAQTEKWYAGTLGLNLNHTHYQIKVRNNPLVEWFVADANGVEIASCGLKSENGKIAIQLSETTTDLMLDFLLWYLFLPVAIENFSTDIPFL